MAEKFELVISSLVHEDQTCVVPGQIQQSMLYMRYWERQLNVDLEKAYDRLSNQFLLTTLKIMGAFLASFWHWCRLSPPWMLKSEETLKNGLICKPAYIIAYFHQVQERDLGVMRLTNLTHSIQDR